MNFSPLSNKDFSALLNSLFDKFIIFTSWHSCSSLVCLVGCRDLDLGLDPSPGPDPDLKNTVVLHSCPLSRAVGYKTMALQPCGCVGPPPLPRPASILYKSIVGQYRPVSYPDGLITARYRFIKNAYWALSSTACFCSVCCGEGCSLIYYMYKKQSDWKWTHISQSFC